jgi:tetratricopeptide (TPR) repeat protein
MEKLKQHARTVWLFLLLAALIVIALLASPYLVSAYHLEAGGRAIERHSDGAAASQGHDLGSAVEHLEGAIRWDPNNAQAYRLMARIYQTQGNWLDAVEMLSRYTELRPKNPLGFIELAELYGKIDAELASMVHFDLAALLPVAEVKVPDSTDIRPYVTEEPVAGPSRTQAGLHRPRPAPVLLLPVPARVTYTLSLPPQPTALRFDIALALDAEDQPESQPEARVTFVVTVDGQPAFSEILDESQARGGWQERSVSLASWAGQEVTLALASIDVSDGPPGDDVRPPGARGWAAWGQPQVVDARSLALEAIDPGQQAALAWRRSGLTLEDLITRGEALRKAGEYEAAMQSYRQAMQLEPGSGDPWYRMGLLYEDEDLWPKALDAYERAAAADNRSQIGKGNALYRMGAIYHLRLDPPQLDAALRAYQAALESDDFASKADEAWVHARLGQVYYDLSQDITRAESKMMKALQLAPDQEWLYVVLGDLYRDEDRVAEARAMYERALELAPGFDAALRRLDRLE